MTAHSYQPPSREDWARLYQVALEFKRMGPENWLKDDEVLGVKDPVTGTTGYCCVSGEDGEDELGTLGVMVFMGDAGLAHCLNTLLVPEDLEINDEDIASVAFDMLFNLHTLSLVFVDREDLEDRDLAIVRSLGLKFRGQKQWPMFRSTRPAFLPWFLDSEEARFLTVVLEQTMEVARQLQLVPDSISPVFSEDRLLVRVPEGRAGGYQWHNQWVKPEVPEAARQPMPPPDINQDLVLQVGSKTRPRQGIWEVDVFSLLSPVGEPDERPYFPRVTMCVDKSSGDVLEAAMDEPWQPMGRPGDYLLRLMARIDTVPRQIDVANEHVQALVEPVCKALGIKLRQARRLPKLEVARIAAALHLGGPQDL